MDDDFEAQMSDSDQDDVDTKVNEGKTDEEIASNKLKHNIAKKGANSYYYAHAKKADAPIVKNEPPQLLETAQANIAKAKLHKEFDKFAWANSTKTVSVYLTYPGADQVDDDKITLVTEKKMLEFKVDGSDGFFHSIKIDKLNGEITGADLKKKADKFVVVLKKVEERTWYKLEE